MKTQINGPQKVATELFANLNSLNGAGINEIQLVDLEGQKQDNQVLPGEYIIKTRRVGLTPKKTDLTNYYLNLNLRYIIILQKFPKFRQTVKGIESIIKNKVASGDLGAETAKNILGYNLK